MKLLNGDHLTIDTMRSSIERVAGLAYERVIFVNLDRSAPIEVTVEAIVEEFDRLMRSMHTRPPTRGELA